MKILILKHNCNIDLYAWNKLSKWKEEKKMKEHEWIYGDNKQQLSFTKPITTPVSFAKANK